MAKNKSFGRKGVGAKLGQHFLRSDAAVKAMCDAAGVNNTTTVLEIGPGEGVLTKELLSRAERVIAIEKDSELVLQLRETFSEEIKNRKLILVEDDIRNIDISSLLKRAVEVDAIQGKDEPQAKRTDMYDERSGDVLDEEVRNFHGSYVVAANIPYYITGEIIRTLLTLPRQPETIALLIQKEVAQRILARDHKESILSLSVKAYGNPRIVKNVPRGSFSPPPTVDSAIISIEDISRRRFDEVGEQRFFDVVRAGFASKRKMLAGNLQTLAEKEKIIAVFEKLSIDPKIRAEDVRLEKWFELTKELSLG